MFSLVLSASHVGPLLSALWSFQRMIPQPWVVSSHTCAEQYAAEYFYQSPQFAPLRYPVLGIAATFFSLDFQLYPFNSGIPSGSTRTPCPEPWPGNPLQAVSRDTGSTHFPCFPPLRDRCPYCLMSAVFQTIVLYILFVCLFLVVSGKRIYLVLLLHLAGGRSIHEQVS